MSFYFNFCKPIVIFYTLNRLVIKNKMKKYYAKQTHTPKFKRWGKCEDINMFNIMRNIFISKNIDEESFFSVAMKNIFDDANEEIVDTEYFKIAEMIAEITNWSRTPYHLLLRIFKLTNNQEFSIREAKLLWSITKPNSSNKLNLNDIAYFFPGKTLTAIRRKINSINDHNDSLNDLLH